MEQLQTWISQIPTEFALIALIGVLMVGMLLKRYFYLQNLKEQL